MLKKVPADKLRTGVYLHKFCGPWMQHPFWRNSFVLSDPADIAAIRASGIAEVWIDTSKGLDVEHDDADVVVAEEKEVPPAAPEPVVQAAPAVAPAAPAVVANERSSMGAEVERAKRICAEAKGAVTSMFREVRMGKAISAEAAAPLVEEISSSVMRNPGALISIARLKTRDDYTYMHSVAVCALMIALARQLGLSESETREAGLGGMMHDLGKALMPIDVLNKPGKLTDEEYNIMKRHPEEGWKLLKEGGGATEVTLDIALHHHEKVDGSGYPHKLAGEDISLMSRMGAVCDVYDAVTSNRPYKAGWDPAESIRRMTSWKGHFDTRVFQAFVKSIGIFPVGSLVRLESGRLGVVVEQGEQSLLAPRVKVFFSARSKEPIKIEVIDLAGAHCQDKITGVEDNAKWGFRNLDDMWANQ